MVVLFGLTIQAQNIPVYTIMHALETNAIAELEGKNEWGVETLRKNIYGTMPAECHLQLPKAGTEKLTPSELYEKRHNSALMFGKTYVCNECPNLHVSLIATATPVTEDGVCLVNYHMVKPIAQRDAFVPGDSAYFVADRDGNIYPLTHILAVAPAEDAAVIKVDTRGNTIEPIPLGESAVVGQHVNLISHPKQLIYTYTQGYVSRNTIYNYPGYPIIDLMEITADFAEGSSGGPIMDDKGNLIGMVKGTTSIFYDNEKRNPQMVLRVSIPVKTLRRLLGI